MHDAIIAERAGVPALAVMTERFTHAAGLMARVLGAPAYAFSVIDHPVSSASNSELRLRAERAAAAIPGILLAAAT